MFASKLRKEWKHAAILADRQLKAHLAQYGYKPIKNSVGVWKHQARTIKFCLCVDDFGVCCQFNTDVQHLISALSAKYKLTMDRSGSNYCRLTLQWDYISQHVNISITG